MEHLLVFIFVHFFMITAHLDVENKYEHLPRGEHKIIYEQINERRSEEGYRRLDYNYELERFAWAYAMDMIERDFFGHYNPEGEDVGDRLDKARVSFSIVGEILAENPSPEGAIEAWFKSPPHYKTIMRDEYESMGVGIASGKGHKYYIVIFYRPLEYPNLGRTVFLGETY